VRGHGEQTVRELRASVREWLSDIDEMVMEIGNDHWLDIDIADFKRIGESADVVSLLQAWGGMAATFLQVASLPEKETE
jgi:hypothetical protein